MVVKKHLISEEQVKVLQDVSDTLNAAIVDERTTFEVTTQSNNGSVTHFVNREQFLEDMVDWALNTLGATFEFLE